MNSPNSSLIWKLRYFICYAGVAGAQRLDTLRRTDFDALFGMQAYLCASKEEWDLLGKTLVCKVNKRLLQAVDLFCEATGERRLLTGAEVFALAEGAANAEPEPGPAKAGTTIPGGQSRVGEVTFVLECIGATLRHYAGQPVTQENLQECVDRIANAVREGGLPGSRGGQDSQNSRILGLSPEPEGFYERLLGEHEQLDDRLNKLEKFIGESPTFAGLPEMDRALLQEQYQSMEAYRSALSARIYRLSQMAEGSRSGGAVEAPVESEATLSNDPSFAKATEDTGGGGDGGDDAPGGGVPGRETQGLGEVPADSGEAARGVVAAEDGQKEALISGKGMKEQGNGETQPQKSEAGADKISALPAQKPEAKKAPAKKKK